MLDFVNKYFWLPFLLGILMGIFLPFSSVFYPYIIQMLMFILFISCLKIDLGKIFKKIKDFKLVAYLVFLILIAVPVVVYFIFDIFLEPDYSLSILILLAMPAGMTVSVLASIFQGDKELALILSVITSLLCPITIPFLIYFLAGVKTSINFFQMFASLATIIFIPFILAMFFRKIGGRIINATEQYYSPLSMLIIMFISAGSVSKINFVQVIGSDKLIIYPFISLFILAILLYVIGYYVIFQKDKKLKITSSLALANMNSTLAIVFAAKFFGPKTLLLVTLYSIAGSLVLIGFGHLIKRDFYSSIKA